MSLLPLICHIGVAHCRQMPVDATGLNALSGIPVGIADIRYVRRGQVCANLTRLLLLGCVFGNFKFIDFYASGYHV